jgi:hypothetical protein
VTHGFISCGGGPFYCCTLQMLSPGDRVWVNMPSTGYVGVGHVTDAAVSLEQCAIFDPNTDTTPNSDRPALDIAPRTKRTDIIRTAESLVRVQKEKAGDIRVPSTETQCCSAFDRRRPVTSEYRDRDSCLVRV